MGKLRTKVSPISSLILLMTKKTGEILPDFLIFFLKPDGSERSRI